MVIPAKYEYAGYFIDGKADVKADGQNFSILLNDPSIYGSSATWSPFKVAEYVKTRSTKDLLNYCKGLGSKFSEKKAKGNTEHVLIGKFENGVKGITESSEQLAVSYEFKERSDKNQSTDRLKADGYVPKEIGSSYVTMTKNGVDITMMSGSNTWIIANSITPGMTQAQLDSAGAVFKANSDKLNQQLIELDKHNEQMRKSEEQLRKAAEEYMEQKKRQENNAGSKP